MGDTAGSGESASVEIRGATVKVVTATGVRDFVRRHGGSVYVWTTAHGVCEGRVVLPEAATEPPRGGRPFVGADAGGFALFLEAAGPRPPRELALELRRGGRRLRAYWDDRAYVNQG